MGHFAFVQQYQCVITVGVVSVRPACMGKPQRGHGSLGSCLNSTTLLMLLPFRVTQHFISDARDGVDGRWVEDMFEGSTRWPRRSCGTAGGAHSQSNRVARQLNERSRETLGFETRAERDLMLVLHRPIEPTAKSRHSALQQENTSTYSLLTQRR